MFLQLQSEPIAVITFLVVARVAVAVSWAIVRQLEEWSERRERLRFSDPSEQFRALANRMLRYEPVGRKSR